MTISEAIVNAGNLILTKTKEAIDDVVAHGVVVDSELKDQSENPVQNKIIKAALDLINDTIDAINDTIVDNKTETDNAITRIDNSISSIQSDLGNVTTSLANKQEALTFDTTPTANSTNPVTSQGIKSYVDNNTPTLSGVSPIVYNNGSISATFDTTPTTNSNNLLTSGAIKTAIDNVSFTAGEGINVSGSTIATDINAGVGISKSVSGNTITLAAVLPTSNPGVDNVLWVES